MDVEVVNVKLYYGIIIGLVNIEFYRVGLNYGRKGFL